MTTTDTTQVPASAPVANEKRAVLAPVKLSGVLLSLSEQQATLAAMPKPSAIVAAQAEAVMSDVVNIETCLAMAAAVVATQKRGVAQVYAGHLIDNAKRAVEAVKSASDADKPRAMEVLRLAYAACGAYVRTTGGNIRDVSTGETRKRSDDEKRAVGMVARTMRASIRLAPRDLSAEHRAEVERIQAEAAQPSTPTVRGPVVEADKAPAIEAPASKSAK